MRWIGKGFLFLLAASGLWAQGGAMHIAQGRVAFVDGSTPAALTFSASLVGRSSNVLTESSAGCGYSTADGVWFVQCANFTPAWNVGDVLRVAMNDGTGFTGSIDVTLTSDADDVSGTTTLSKPAHSAKLSVSDFSVARGSNFDLPISLTVLGVPDSVVAYEITLSFDSDALLPLGGVSDGTMTDGWGDPFASPKESEMVLGGFTTNQPSTRLVADGGVLVKARFQAQGLPGSETSAMSLVRIERAVIHLLAGSVTIANTRTGAVTVTSAGSPASRSYTLYPYWNMISLGMAPDPNTIPEVFGGLDVEYVFGYNVVDGPRSWDVRRPSFLNTLSTLDGLHGYWVKIGSTSNLTWNVSGTAIDVNTPISLGAGWNLVAYLPAQSDSLGHALGSIKPHYSYVMTHNAQTQMPSSWDVNRPSFLNSLKNMTPNAGHWIRMDQYGVLSYPLNGYATAKPLPVPVEWMARAEAASDTIQVTPYVCEFWGVQPDILSPGDTLRAYDPQNVLCGRAVVTPEQGFLIYVYGDDASTPGQDEGAVTGDTLQFTLNGDAVQVAQGSAVWSERESIEIQLALAETGIDPTPRGAPSGFRLYPNYPNPFNGETVIRFALNALHETTVEILNARGQQVRALTVKAMLGEGVHEYHWDGRDAWGNRVASGIYLYRIRAGRQVKTGKMVFVQ